MKIQISHPARAMQRHNIFVTLMNDKSIFTKIYEVDRTSKLFGNVFVLPNKTFEAECKVIPIVSIEGEGLPTKSKNACLAFLKDRVEDVSIALAVKGV
jgi:hypothetical protein